MYAIIQYSQQAGFTRVPVDDIDAGVMASEILPTATVEQVGYGTLLTNMVRALKEHGGTWEDVETVAKQIGVG